MRPVLAVFVLLFSAIFSSSVCARETVCYRLLPARSGAQLAVREIVIIPHGKRDSGGYRWEMKVVKSDDSTFTIEIVSDHLPMTTGDGDIGRVYSYRLQEGDRPWIEYRNKETGGPLLPEYDFLTVLIPRPSKGSIFKDGYATSGRYLGQAVVLGTERAICSIDIIGGLGQVSLNLDPGLMIGTGRTFRDTNVGRLPLGSEYNYRPFTPEEYDEMVAAGVNYFIADSDEREKLIYERPVFYEKKPTAKDFPQILYRSNYHGSSMFLDEPAILIDYQGCKEITDCSNFLRLRVADSFNEESAYGSRRTLAAAFRQQGISLGEWDLLERDIPIWETIYETAFYQLSAGPSGLVHEGRYNLDLFNRQLENILGPGASVTAKDMFDIHFAVLRGAARCFDKDWGISIYGQADPKLSPTALSRAYDQGARWLWFWTSDHDHHMPYREQLELTRQLRKHEKEHPRRPRFELLKSAEVAIVYPEGYTTGEAGLWKTAEFGFQRFNPHKAMYGDVIGAGLWQAILLAQKGVRFDFVIEDDSVKKAGYRRLIKVKTDGTVENGETAGIPKQYDLKITQQKTASPQKTPLDVPRVIALPVKPGQIKIDGNVDEWANSGWIEPKQMIQNREASEEDNKGFTARCALAYDFRNLYFAAVVRYNNGGFAACAPPGGAMWRGDSVQMAFDPVLDRRTGSHAPDDVELGLALTDPTRPHTGPTSSSWRWTGREAGPECEIPEAMVCVGTWDETTYYEARIPFSELAPLNPGLMNVCGYNVAVNDWKGPKRWSLEWTPELVVIKDPSSFGLLEFKDADKLLSEPVGSFYQIRTVSLDQHPAAFGLKTASNKETAATLIARIHTTGGARVVKKQMKIPSGRSDFRIELGSPLKPGQYLVDLELISTGRSVCRMNRRVYVGK